MNECPWCGSPIEMRICAEDGCDNQFAACICDQPICADCEYKLWWTEDEQRQEQEQEHNVPF